MNALVQRILTFRQLRVLAPLALLAIGGGAFVALGSSADAQPEARAIPVSTLGASAVDSYTTTRAFSGKVVARRTANLGFERSGKLLEVLVTEGQAVSKGATLARLDVRRLEARRAELEALLAQAEARLAEMQAGPRQETIAATRARLRELGADVELLRRRKDRREATTRQSVTTQEELDAATYALEAGIARRDALQRQLDELLAGTRSEQVDAQKALVRQLGAQLEQVEIDLVDSVLVAPFEGSVGTVALDEGTVVSPGQPVLRLVERAGLEAWVGVPPAVAAELEPGSAQQVLVEGRPHPARLRAVLPELDPVTRTSTVVLTLDAPGALQPHQVVRLVVRQSVDQRGYWLPLSALSKGDRDLWSCLVVRPDDEGVPVARRLLVTVLEIEADRALVEAAFAPDERIVASGTNRVVVGQRVAPQ